MPATTLADIIFPEQANHNFSKILGDLKRSNLSITNRLRSVRHDAAFVEQVADALRLPLVANERCGSWYIEPGRKAASAYFKSTDGHTGQWKFSTRRLNLQLLELIGRRDGCIIVDSTRRGKRMPDSLSKTIPTWCSVLNCALFPDDPACHALFVPPNAVFDSEKSQMEARLPEFLASFLALDIDIVALRKHLRKPLRPLWITQDDYDPATSGPLDAAVTGSFHPVVCCTSSRRVAGTELSEAGYIQGAGDDTENWALGLTAPIFWEHADELMSTPEVDLPDLIRSLVASSDAKGASASEAKQVAPHIFVGALSGGQTPLSSSSSFFSSPGSCVVAVTSQNTEQSSWLKSPSYLEVGVGKGKVASRLLRQALPQICDFVSQFLERPEVSVVDEAGLPVKKRVVILCESGKDLSVGAALALCCWCFDASGNIIRSDDTARQQQQQSFTKNAIRIKLGHIMTVFPEANPSRATLQSVNSFLMDWRK
ncbi:tRNA A64-2'-O-ribosylphosphate transferase [Bombardia bombarda]|uniref:tRNA A64-2'-O-ribosylphosphate transferase n=1 Tax=Bombardia bombarda TaxID=252184 RepID=A0AA40BW75_9PEZI|nr:tRNA A64-2'-O-ribosylphosphate transferase [Bombardia bombarda]